MDNLNGELDRSRSPVGLGFEGWVVVVKGGATYGLSACLVGWEMCIREREVSGANHQRAAFRF